MSTTTTTRRVKSRSKSETLSEITSSSSSGFLTFNDVKPPRSVSDSFVSSTHASIIMPLSSNSSNANTTQSLDGNYSGHRHSYDWSSSIASDSPSSDQAIDSDILSVLADCDSSDVEGSDAIDGFGGDNGPPSTSSFRSQRSLSFGGEPTSGCGGLDGDQDMMAGVSGLNCFDISETAPVTLATVGGLRIDDLFQRAEGLERGSAGTTSASHHHSHTVASPAKQTLDLEPFAIKSEHNWATGAPSPASSDSGYLSTHMEKMSMIHTTALSQSPHHQSSDVLVPLPIPATATTTTVMNNNSVAATAILAPEERCLPGVMANLDQFAAVSIESFSVVKQEREGDLVPESMEICEPEGKESFVRMMETDDEAENQHSGVAGMSHANWIFKYDDNHNNSISSSMAIDHAMHHGDASHQHGRASMGMKSEQQQHPNQNQQMHWMKDFPSLVALEAQNQYVDELFQETMAAATATRGPHEWKAHKQPHMATDNYSVREIVVCMFTCLFTCLFACLFVELLSDMKLVWC